MLGTLLQLDRSLRRNRRRRSGLGQLALLAAGIGAAVGLGLGGDALLAPGEAGLEGRAESWVFWCMTVAALVLGYTSFEVLYRDEVTRRLGFLPLSAEPLYWWRVLRVYRAHLPLVLLPATSGATLLVQGQWLRWAEGVGATLGIVLWGVALAMYAHLWAGQSLLDGATRMKQYLASGFGPPETAFLFYSPALTLAATMVIGIFVELSLRAAVTQAHYEPILIVSGVATAASAMALWKAREIFLADHHRIAPRFNDAEIPPPWKEGELPRGILGADLDRWLPEAARPLWRRDLTQYRRRFRVAVPLVVAGALALLFYAWGTADTGGATLRIIVATAAAGVLAFTPVFRAAGPELATRYDTRALPVRSGDERRVQWLLAFTECAPLGLAATLGALLGGLGAGALIVLAGAAAAFLATNALAIPLALRAAPEVGRISLVLRGGLLLALGGVSILARVVS